LKVENSIQGFGRRISALGKIMELRMYRNGWKESTKRWRELTKNKTKNNCWTAREG